MAGQEQNPDFNESFALEIALGIEPPDQVRLRYGVSEVEWSDLQDSRVFRDVVENYQIKARLSGKISQLTARILIEKNIATLSEIIVSHKDDPKAAMDAWRELSKLAGNSESKDGPQTADASDMRTIAFFTPKETMVESVPKSVDEDTPETIGWTPNDAR